MKFKADPLDAVLFTLFAWMAVVVAYAACTGSASAQAAMQQRGQPQQEQPAEWPPEIPVDLAVATRGRFQVTSVSNLRDPAPAANPVIPKWENAYNELVGTPYEQFIRPGSAGRPDAPEEMWAKQYVVDHIGRLHGKGGLPFNPHGKFWYTPGVSWGVGTAGWNDHYDMIYQIHRVYHFQGALFGQPWGNVAWWLPEFRAGSNFGTPRPTGTATKFQYWDYSNDWKYKFLWWRWFKQTGICHPYCIGAWSAICGQNCVSPATAGPIKVREVLGANVPVDVALRSMAESFALFEREHALHARGWDKVRTR